MVLQFKIIHIHFHHNRGQFIVSYLLGNTLGQEIKDGSLLGDIPIYYYKKMGNGVDENGIARTDIFV